MTHISPDLQDRIRTLALPGETPEATIARALGKLEAPPLLAMGDAHFFPWAYPRAAKVMAVRLRAGGASWSKVRKALLDVCGRAPGEDNLRRLLRGWALAEERVAWRYASNGR